MPGREPAEVAQRDHHIHRFHEQQQIYACQYQISRLFQVPGSQTQN